MENRRNNIDGEVKIMTWLQEQLTKMGACQSQVNSSTVKMVERAMAEDSEFIEKTALDVLERLADTFEEAKKNTAELVRMVNQAEQKADGIVSAVTSEAKKEISGLEAQIKSLQREKMDFVEGRIYDAELAEAVKAYKAALMATKDVFGESMDAETRIAAINAGSYIAWRGMPDQKEYVKKKPL